MRDSCPLSVPFESLSLLEEECTFGLLMSVRQGSMDGGTVDRRRGGIRDGTGDGT